MTLLTLRSTSRQRQSRIIAEVVVVDSFSSDRTVDICRKYTDRIYQHEYINSAMQKNWALQHVSTEWVLQVDSDEQVEPQLCDEIRNRLSQSEQPDGYRVRIKNFIWGKWVRCCGMYPCAQVRLFKTAKGNWSDREVHAHLEGVNHIYDLQHHIIHADVDDLSAELEQFGRRVVLWESNELIKQGRQWHWWDVTLRPAAIWFLYYFLRGGYREGFRGLFLSVYRAFYSFMTYSRLYEKQVYLDRPG